MYEMFTAMDGAVRAVVSPEAIAPDTVNAIPVERNKPPSGRAMGMFAPAVAGMANVITEAVEVVAAALFCKCR